MAETKSKAKKAKPKSKRSSSNGSSRSSKASKATSRAKSAPSSSSNGNGAAGSVKETVVSGAHGVGQVAEKAKLPLLATGAALAGAAAVMVGKNGHKQRKVLGVPMPKRSKSHLPKVSLPKVGAHKMSLPKGKGLKGDVRRAAGAVTDAAKQADEIGRRISRVANSVQAVGEATDDAAKKS